MDELDGAVAEALVDLDRDDVENLTDRARTVRNLIHGGRSPQNSEDEIFSAYRQLPKETGLQSAYVAER